MFDWQDVKNDARQVVHRTFAVPGIHYAAASQLHTNVDVRILSTVEWTDDEGVQYQVENTYAYVEDDRLENLYRGDTLTKIKSGEVYTVVSTLPKEGGMLKALVVKESGSQS